MKHDRDQGHALTAPAGGATKLSDISAQGRILPECQGVAGDLEATWRDNFFRKTTLISVYNRTFLDIDEKILNYL